MTIYQESFFIYSDITLYVPKDSKEAYAAADYWKNFKEIIEVIGGDTNGDSVIDVTDVPTIVNYIINKPDENFNELAVDVNGDGKVDVSDVVRIVNRIIIGSQTVASAPQDTIHYVYGTEEKVINLPIPATSIQPMLEEFMNDKDQPENRVFYLEGGKEYFLKGMLYVYKGFTLQTNPEDIAVGKGRAKVYMYDGVILLGNSSAPAFFMMGRMPLDGEEPTATTAIDQMELKDIDFSVPLARNIGDGGSSVSGNFVFNQHPKALGFVAENLNIQNCSTCTVEKCPVSLPSDSQFDAQPSTPSFLR